MQAEEVQSRVRPLIEAGVVYTGMVLAFRPLALALGAGPASSRIVQFLLFALAPVAWVFLRRHDPTAFGLRFETGSSFRLAFRAFSIVGPACLVFPLMAWVGSSPDQWLGSVLAAIVFLAALPLVVRATQSLPIRGSRGGSGSLVALVSVAAVATALSALTATSLPIVSRVLYYALVVGIGEEVAFRGLLQSLLNRAFGRPWQWRGVSFGPGLLIAALLFGLAHTIVGSGFRLQVALFTTIFGLTLGYLREKDGSVLAPAILHGLAGLPRAFFS